MLSNKSKKLTLTLVASLVFISSLSPVSATNDFQVHRRNHGLNRLVKKRSPQILSGILGETSDAATTTGTPATTPATASATTGLPVTSPSTAASLPASSVPQSAPSAPSSVSNSASRSASASASSASASASVSNSASSSASASSNSAVSSPSTTTSPTTSAEGIKVTQPPAETEIVITSDGKAVTVTSTAAPAAQQTEETNTQSGASSDNNHKARTTALTVLIVIASSVGAVLLIWTIFRKWKLARSSKFDERLQPIDWQPTSADEGIIPANRRRYSNASSFRSGITGNGGYGATSASGHGGSDHGHRGGMEHDFTAGPTHLAPVGGYADLARGPSPGPMQELSRGPSFNRPNYDNGVPLHHQTPYGRY
ncbi:hypothetical protein PQX77_008234 [Marasmius sp. AFHP31]|nr:hypothetical protein PQX77_008293 [Marasmius sp. AFHP31]KAK1228740.1 hypothetical protein PQX77_008234 [Marasmius sp. AFHP31]